MDKFIDIIYDVIGNEKGIAMLIVKYFYVETIIENELKTINITNIIGEQNYVKFVWIDDDYFYNVSNNMCNIYNIRNKNIKIVCSDINLNRFNISNIHKIIMVDNILIIVGINCKSMGTDLFKYNYETKEINFMFEIKYYRSVAKVLDEIIVITDCIHKYNYYDGTKINTIGIIYDDIDDVDNVNLMGNNIIKISDHYLSIINVTNLKIINRIAINTFDNSNLDRINECIVLYNNNSDYDYTYRDTIVYNMYDMSMKKCDPTFDWIKKKSNYYKVYLYSNIVLVLNINNNNYAHDADIYDLYTHEIIKQIHFKCGIHDDYQLVLSPNNRHIIYYSENMKESYMII